MNASDGSHWGQQQHTESVIIKNCNVSCLSIFYFTSSCKQLQKLRENNVITSKNEFKGSQETRDINLHFHRNSL